MGFLVAKKLSIVGGPVVSKVGNRTRWQWVVERTIGDKVQKVEAASRADAARIFRDAILQAIGEEFSVFARFVDQTGGGDETEYGADGSILARRSISPKEGLIGPRCFVTPLTTVARKARTASLRPPKDAKPPKPPKPPKPAKPGRKPKASKPPAKPPSAKPATAKPPSAPKPKPKPRREPKPKAEAKVPALVQRYLDAQAAGTARAFVGGLKGIQIAQVVRWVNQHGSAADKAALEAARAKGSMRTSSKPAPRVPTAPPRAPTAPRTPTAPRVSAAPQIDFDEDEPGGDQTFVPAPPRAPTAPPRTTGARPATAPPRAPTAPPRQPTAPPAAPPVDAGQAAFIAWLNRQEQAMDVKS